MAEWPEAASAVAKKPPVVLILKISFVSIFFFSGLKQNSPDLHGTFDRACESVVTGGKDR